jgi:hypothetical protein
LNDLIAHYLAVISKTLEKRDRTERNTALYEKRLHLGGRIDCFYKDINLRTLSNGKHALSVSEFDQYRFIINGVSYSFDWNRCINSLREHFDVLNHTWTAITQGDPTAVNIGYPLVWMDFENSGHNAIFGEFANFCWDTYVLGGYLVPKYGARSIRDHPATLRFAFLNAPTIERFEIDHQSKRIFVDYRMVLPSARRVILKKYFEGLMTPVIAQTNPAGWQCEFAQYLSLRIIGVYDIFAMSSWDLLFSLVKLIEAQDKDFDFTKFFAA